MLNEILLFLKNKLNEHLRLMGKNTDTQEDQVVFPTGQSGENLSFKLGAISMMLINLEQENALRPPNLYERRQPDGSTQKVQPEIRMNIYLLIAAHYQQYEDSLRNLSGIIQYFQNHRLFTHQDAPQLPVNVDQLIVELHTPSFTEQSQIWGALRQPYRPSVVYRVKMAVFQDENAKAAPEISETSMGFIQ